MYAAASASPSSARFLYGSYPRELSLVFHRRRIVFTLRELDEELQEYHVVVRRCCEAAAPSFLALVQGVRVCRRGEAAGDALGLCFRVLPGALLAAIADCTAVAAHNSANNVRARLMNLVCYILAQKCIIRHTRNEPCASMLARETASSWASG